MSDAVFNPDAIREQAEKILLNSGFGRIVRIEQINGSGNNRGFNIETGTHRLFLKAYFRHPDDPRDRLDVEYRFSLFAWNHGVRSIPEPLAIDREAGLGVYAFVEGRAIQPEEIAASHVESAIVFWDRINAFRDSVDASALPDASEACFSIFDHMATVERRLARLRAIDATTNVDRAARAFVAGELSDAWGKVTDKARQRCAALGFDAAEILPKSARRLSASDFGFHNAIIRGESEIVFFDFEYAGWDDPAKTVCDFFCQPRVPAPLALLEAMIQATIREVQAPHALEARIRMLLAVYRIKWCCIMLNEFLPLGAHRRAFAAGAADVESAKIVQLARSRQSLRSLGNLESA